ncbi:hypothetical protein JX265_004113 [Neoarthrinium moseri]|uniref:Uncharacterized protein n=1 Tax=Neoarthrinium moseri TaxID=1658444 RepID=A0A9P9WS47_9PEZI|nr:uncharacterized protein JN550_008701 [Neoarthrinium moseri]KAI1853556.1 hypothetical protein JX266_001540 [Neoarthrinium moseri]KAI1864881.1 hypothetical protein JN550_008701 [Neoarthrinium moseri]KAI1876587.1 hypothetical protein JX265_004113 [Neoarthrinium moseri]
MPPSGTEQAKQKFQAGIEKTRQAANPAPGESTGTNPKLGAAISKLAKGETEASLYTAKGGPSGTDRTKEPGGL